MEVSVSLNVPFLALIVRFNPSQLPSVPKQPHNLFHIFSTFEKEIMSAIQTLNPKAEFARAAAALQVNTSAAIGLQNVLKTNLGPKGTMKM